MKYVYSLVSLSDCSETVRGLHKTNSHTERTNIRVIGLLWVCAPVSFSFSLFNSNRAGQTDWAAVSKCYVFRSEPSAASARASLPSIVPWMNFRVHWYGNRYRRRNSIIIFSHFHLFKCMSERIGRIFHLFLCNRFVERSVLVQFAPNYRPPPSSPRRFLLLRAAAVRARNCKVRDAHSQRSISSKFTEFFNESTFTIVWKSIRIAHTTREAIRYRRHLLCVLRW